MKYFKKLHIRIILIVGIIMLVSNSCIDILHKPLIPEGIITYKISYTENNLGHAATNILPRKMLLKFNKRYTHTSIDGFMGVFSIELITDMQKNISHTLLKVFDKKYIYSGVSGEHSCIFDYMSNLTIKASEKEKTILSYNAFSANVFNHARNTSFPVFYTPDIGHRKPNKNNPYEDIEGVLLEFQLQLDLVNLELTADKITPEKIPDKKFALPKDYTPISRTQIAKLLKELMEK